MLRASWLKKKLDLGFIVHIVVALAEKDPECTIICLVPCAASFATSLVCLTEIRGRDVVHGRGKDGLHDATEPILRTISWSIRLLSLGLCYEA